MNADDHVLPTLVGIMMVILGYWLYVGVRAVWVKVAGDDWSWDKLTLPFAVGSLCVCGLAAVLVICWALGTLGLMGLESVGWVRAR